MKVTPHIIYNAASAFIAIWIFVDEKTEVSVRAVTARTDTSIFWKFATFCLFKVQL